MSPTIQDAINDQIQAELASAYTYLAMSARFDELNLKGFARWLRIQWQEEEAHALKFFEHVLRRGGRVELKAIAAPVLAFKTALEAFEQVLEHERYITRRIHELYDLAVQENDYALRPLLLWFIDEQVEEEESATEIVDTLRRMAESPAGLYVLDRELGRRGGD
jgi:ferritin